MTTVQEPSDLTLPDFSTIPSSSFSATSLKIQFLSDIHLELRKFEKQQPIIEPRAPFLALLGDIGKPADPYSANPVWLPLDTHNHQDIALSDLGILRGKYNHQYWLFLKKVSSLFSHIFVLTGNHEYYFSPISKIDYIVQCMCQALGNVTFLNKNSFLLHHTNGIDNFVITGCTLWTNVPPQHSQILSTIFNDFRQIEILEKDGKSRLLTVDDTNLLHRESVQFIEMMITQVQKQQKMHPQQRYRLIVMTHHAPISNSILFNQGQLSDVIAAGCFTPLEHLMDGQTLCCWMYGHTHLSLVRAVNGCLVVSNQLGYPQDKETFHREGLYVSIPLHDAPNQLPVLHEKEKKEEPKDQNQAKRLIYSVHYFPPEKGLGA